MFGIFSNHPAISKESIEFMGLCEQSDASLAINWYYDHNTIDIRAMNDRAFRNACTTGNVVLAKFLWDHGVLLQTCDHAGFRLACINHHVNLATWFRDMDPGYCFELDNCGQINALTCRYIELLSPIQSHDQLSQDTSSDQSSDRSSGQFSGQSSDHLVHPVQLNQTEPGPCHHMVDDEADEPEYDTDTEPCDDGYDSY